jgi:serine/threonine protein kinase
MFRKAPEGKLKRYWFCLLGKELYCYRKQNEDKHKGMHSLIGVYVLEEEEEKLENGVTLFPFKLIFPNNKARTYYLLNAQERNQWVKVIKEAIGFRDIEEFYEIGEDIGKGKFGQVKKAIHKKSNNLVAIKVIKKKEMKPKELEL